VTKAGQQIKAGTTLLVDIPEIKVLDLEAQDIELNILYEDKDLLVVDKPAGMIVHPVAGIRKDTLVNALLRQCRDLSGIGGCIRPGIVHRLDKDTSGVMVVAKNDAAHQGLSSQFNAHKVKKTYLTLVWGKMAYQRGSIDMAIERGREDRTKMKVTNIGGRQAKTVYETIKQSGRMALLRIFPETGRTHQIRVHLSYLNHPIVGDKKYARGQANDGINRQMLHAETLSFRHPVSGKKVTFKAELPEDFKEVMRANEIS
jgi:23S rRNA pseudouridine1911/1915/1917 synthase